MLRIVSFFIFQWTNNDGAFRQVDYRNIFPIFIACLAKIGYDKTIFIFLISQISGLILSYEL